MQVIVGTVLILLIVVAMLLAWIFPRRISRQWSQNSSGVVSVSHGDMRAVEDQGAEELADLLDAMRQMQAALCTTIETIDYSAGRLTTAAGEMSMVAESDADGMQKRLGQADKALKLALGQEAARSLELVIENNTLEQSTPLSSLRAKIGNIVSPGGIRRNRNPTRLVFLDPANDVPHTPDRAPGFTSVENGLRPDAKPTPTREQISALFENLVLSADTTVSALQRSGEKAAFTLEVAKSAELAIEQIIVALSTMVARRADVVCSTERRAGVEVGMDRNFIEAPDSSPQRPIETQTNVTSGELSRIVAKLNQLVSRFSL